MHFLPLLVFLVVNVVSVDWLIYMQLERDLIYPTKKLACLGAEIVVELESPIGLWFQLQDNRGTPFAFLESLDRLGPGFMPSSVARLSL